jgi:hypothetical protein
MSPDCRAKLAFSTTYMPYTMCVCEPLCCWLSSRCHFLRLNFGRPKHGNPDHRREVHPTAPLNKPSFFFGKRRQRGELHAF